MEWIKCTNQMPEVGQWVLVYEKGGVQGGLEVDTEQLICPGHWRGQGICSDISHWMPLPSPPDMKCTICEGLVIGEGLVCHHCR